jgi:hypothetical protein
VRRSCHAGDLIQLLHLIGKRGEQLLDPAGQLIGLGAERVDAVQHHPQQVAVVGAEVPGDRLLQDAQLGAHPALRQLREHLRVALPGDQRLQHLATRHPEHVADHCRQFDLGVFQQLLHTLLLPSPLMDKGAPVAGEVPQLWLPRRRHQPWPQHAPLGQLGQPDGVLLVRLRPARHVLDLAGVHQPARTRLLQQIERRLPVGGRRLHHHPGHPQAVKPVRQAQQRPGRGGEGANLLTAPAWLRIVRHPDTRHQHRLADIQRGHPLHQLGRLLADLLHVIVLSGYGRDSEGGPPAGTNRDITRRNRVLNGNNAGPLAMVPCVRLCYGLTGTKHHRRRRATQPDFHASRASPQGHSRLCCVWSG